MKGPRGGLASRPLLYLFLFVCLTSLLVGHVAAQRDNTDAPSVPNSRPQPTRAPETDRPSPPRETDRPLPPPPAETDDDDDDNNRPTTAAPPPARPTPSATQSPPTQSRTPDNLPGLSESETSSTTTTSESTRTGASPTFTLPSLTGGPVIPTPQIPPKEGAPYLKKSDLPEGTIFIAVGAALGFFAVAVVAWRLLVAWSINRSVRRATNNSHPSDATALLNPNTRKSRVYQNPAGAPISREKVSKDRHSRVGPSHTPNQSLFFSPTAGASMHTPGNRGSGYLPAGYYSASSAAPGGGAGLAHLSTSSIGLSPLGPQAQGYSRTRSGPSPPGSPGLPPSSRGHDQAHPSTSSLNLSTAPQGRAPSAYLEDLFENHPPGR
ncbi:predicted protein [Uncinocarpus reesii 1704]|uniref:Uncharacterized protein n=1 Tax=Uncinocarpus reesii (strain UAMH 1704) TaxID=336963 RepID=C4K004_UNCRE|nr:uncharacterized protein UREG_07755 [Uncinocarpus reesii 1704]EEP82890.1 predicted protein [Uncinocarpus reesii 1704]